MRLRARCVFAAHRAGPSPAGFLACGVCDEIHIQFGFFPCAGVRAAWSGIPAFGCAPLAQGVGSGAGVWRSSLAVAGVIALVVWRCGRRWLRFGGGGLGLLCAGCAGLRSAAGGPAVRWSGVRGQRSGCGAASVAGQVAGAGSAAAGAGLGAWVVCCLVFCLLVARLAPGFLLPDKNKIPVSLKIEIQDNAYYQERISARIKTKYASRCGFEV